MEEATHMVSILGTTIATGLASGGITIFLVKRMIKGLDNELADNKKRIGGLFNRVDDVGKQVAEHLGYHKGLEAGSQKGGRDV